MMNEVFSVSLFKDLPDPNSIVQPGTYSTSYVQSELITRREGLADEIIVSRVKLHTLHGAVTVTRPTLKIAVYEDALKDAQRRVFQDTPPPPDAWDLHVFIP